MNGKGLKYVACGLAVAAVANGTATAASAAKSDAMRGSYSRSAAGRSVSLEQWPGQRVVLVLPLSLGPNWNADPALGRALLDDTQSRLESALRATNKLSLLLLHRFDPVLVRAVQEKKITDAELTEAANPLSTVPWLTRGRTILGKLTAEGHFFEQPPLIGDFSIEELRNGGDARRPSIQMQVSGRFYELGAAAPRTLIATSDAVRVTKDPYDAILLATRNAFAHVADDFTKPIDAYNLPQTTLVTRRAGPTGTNPPAMLIPSLSLPTGPQPVPPTLPDGTPLPGSVPIAGSSTRNRVPPPGPGPQATTIGPPNTTTLPTTTAPTAPALPGRDANPNGTGAAGPVPAPAPAPATGDAPAK